MLWTSSIRRTSAPTRSPALYAMRRVKSAHPFCAFSRKTNARNPRATGGRMSTNRREFIEHLGAAAMLGALPLSAVPKALREFTPPAAPDDFDFSWTSKLKGKAHKAVFDNAEVESGYGVWRAGMWEPQYHASFGLKPADTQTVLVLRHNAIVLAFQQPFWDQYGIGAQDKVTHPITQQSTTKN